ncbi:glycosyltransferase family 4 protein [Nocardioides rubriscoriae]|uniref:glycosyltransferase family 4 protein n=1 Tax=Nocardioides rubriscoriae TaxID=642762 RepID=UPI0011DFF69A|nr:glycosyltransferase family 4 protein [Nocardioides rubriscoriae]
MPSTASAPSRLAGARVVVVNWRDLDHSLAGGSEHYAWELATGLRRAGAQVTFVTARERGAARRTVRDGIDVRRGGGTFGFYAYAAWSLLRRRRTVDVVIDPSCGIPTFSPLFVRRATPVVMVMHHVHQEQFATYFLGPVARFGQWLEKVAMPRVYRRARVVAVSDSTRVEMVRALGWTTPVGLLENGATVPAPDHTGHLAADVDRMVVLGRLVPHKRVDLVLRTLHALREERPGLHLDVCGKGPELDRLRALATELDLDDRVTFHGFVTEETKRAVLRRAALHVCASDSEGWGQVVIEAAGHGVTTVARDVPGLRDSVRPGVTGTLVPDDADPDVVGRRLTDAVRTALTDLDDPDHRGRTHRACQEWAAHFSWERMHREGVDLVAAELGRHPTPVPLSPAPTTAASVLVAAPTERY